MKSMDVKRNEAAQRQAKYDKLSTREKLNRILEMRVTRNGCNEREFNKLTKQLALENPVQAPKKSKEASK